MACSLESAKACARQGAWHAVLGLERGACVDDIRKARRRLQLSCHEDKGGSGELSQLINRAADTLLERCPEVRAQRAEARAQEEAEERRQREEQRAREQEERARRMEEQCREDRKRAHKRALATTSARGGRARTAVYLSWSTGLVFRTLKHRIDRLQVRRFHARARCLAYAAEAEIAARRAARETKFPTCMGLAARDPYKAQWLARLKRDYDRAYQRLRYVRRMRQPQRCAALTVARLLREAWGVLLAQPAPVQHKGEAIQLGSWEGRAESPCATVAPFAASDSVRTASATVR